MSLLCTSGPSGVKVKQLSAAATFGFYACWPQVALTTFQHLVIIGNHSFLLVCSSRWSQQQCKGRYYKGVELGGLADTTCTLVSGRHVPAPVNRLLISMLKLISHFFWDDRPPFSNWKFIRFRKRRLPEGNILHWWAIVIGRRSFVILWICLRFCQLQSNQTCCGCWFWWYNQLLVNQT